MALPMEVDDDHQLADGMSMNLLAGVLQQAQLSVWVADNADGDFAIKLWNPGAEMIYGYSPAEALGRNYIELFVSPKDRVEAIDSHRRIVEEGREFVWNFVADDISKDGTSIAVLGNSFRVWDEESERYLYAEVGIDISNFEHIGKQIERAGLLGWLQEGTPRKDIGLVRGLEELNEAIAMLSQPDERGLERVVGAIRDSAHQMLLRDLLCRVWMFDDAETPRLASGSDLLKKPPRHSETELARRVADSKSIELLDIEGSLELDGVGYSLVGLPLHIGKELRSVVLLYLRGPAKLTEADRAMFAPFSSYAAVAMLVATLAREQQRRRYEETERYRHAIIESVLHTVGNEAGLAKLAADGLAKELGVYNLSAKARRELDQIQSSAEKLGHLMGELIRLNVSVDEPTRLQLTEAVRIVTRTVERDYYDRITIDHDIDPCLWIEASEYLVREAISNLIRNAVQAMISADGGGELRISADMVEREWNGRFRHVVRLDIEDSGPGVLSDFHDRIWESGFTTRGEGHGYGLYHTRGLVTMLGGAVELIKAPSKLGGAHFRLFLVGSP